MRKIGVLFLLIGCCSLAFAQRTITGKVTDEDGENLIGVAVLVKGQPTGSITDINGKYSIDVTEEAKVLLFSYTGYKTEEVEIGSSSEVNLVMKMDVLGLEDVVVTALGISKEKKKLGYAVQDIKGEEISGNNETNVFNSLSGRVAGANITSGSGSVGSSTRITLRGNASILGNNQPLIIVDGIPIDNSAPGNDGYGGVDYGNAAADINPDDIESVSVLKGPNAAALYGSRAANGAIVITTKSGKRKGGVKGLGVTYSSALTLQRPFRLPDYQNEYGQGYNGEFEYKDGLGGGTMDGVDESWGPKLDGQPRAQFTGNDPWVAHPDNVKNFFETGATFTNNFAVSSSGERAYGRLSFTNTNQKGMLPNTDLTRNALNATTGINISDRLSAEVKATYTQNKSDNIPGNGYDGVNVMQQFNWFGRQVDIERLKDYKNEDGTQFNWNHNYHNNPYWILNENVNPRNRDRVNGVASLTYDLTNWLKVKGSVGNDFYTENRKRIVAMNTVGFPDGRFYEDELNRRERNSTLSFIVEKQLSDKVDISGMLGGNSMYQQYRRSSVSVLALTVPEIYNVSNANGNPSNDQFFSEKSINSIYGNASLFYDRFLNLDVALRRDVSSTLPAENNAYLYPSASVSFLFTEKFSLPSFFSFGKVRASWAQVGNDTDPYQLLPVYNSSDPFNGNPSFTVNNVIPAADLKPETTNSLELGTELKFYNNRLGVDFTYYKQNTLDQIMPVAVSPTTGYTSKIINAGNMQNSGVEIMMYLSPLKSKTGLNWDVTFNFSKNKNKVLELADGVDALRLGRYWGVTLEARPGEPYGVMVGNPTLRDDAGRLIVNAKGLPQKAQEVTVLGNVLPDWRGGVRNSFSYKNFDLSFLIDMRKGGDIFSMSYIFGRYAGILEETVENNIRETGIIVEGVKEEDGTPNDQKVTAQQYNHNFYSTQDMGIFDGSFVKFRELSIGYSIPASIIKNTPIGSLKISVIGRNLLLLQSNIPHIDPETAFGAGNGVMGFEYGQQPSARSVGFSVRASF